MRTVGADAACDEKEEPIVLVLIAELPAFVQRFGVCRGCRVRGRICHRDQPDLHGRLVHERLDPLVEVFPLFVGQQMSAVHNGFPREGQKLVSFARERRRCDEKRRQECFQGFHFVSFLFCV